MLTPTAPAAARTAPPRPPPAGAADRPPPPPVGGLDAAQRADLDLRFNSLDGLDYFELLRVGQNAVPAEIKKAFYRESRTYHPDRFFQVADEALKEKIRDVYKRVTEAYYVLRDDQKRRKYLADITGPERAQKLRFSEASEVETKAAVKKEAEEQIGTHPKGRQFYQTASQDIAAERWSSAERNLKMALTFEPANARYKEKLAEMQKKLTDIAKATGMNFKIK